MSPALRQKQRKRPLQRMEERLQRMRKQLRRFDEQIGRLKEIGQRMERR
jgi:hypothetical protein